MKIIKKSKTAAKTNVEAVTENIALTEDSLPTLTAANIQAMFKSPEFKNIPSEAEIEGYLASEEQKDTIESLETIDETAMSTCLESYLTEVYSNVTAFKVSNYKLTNRQLIVEGQVIFNNGKAKKTIFEFMADGKNMLAGKNKGIAENASFSLAYSRENTKLLAECLKYSYTIKNSLVEGLCKSK